LFLGPGKRFDNTTRRLIDVDGTIAHDVGIESPIAPALWNPGDELAFTIDPIADGMVLDAITGAVLGAAPPIDGGEIMHLVKTAPGVGPGTFAICFLSHGGHLWDTAFDVRGTFGYFYEDVDALEVAGTLTGDTDIPTPEPASMLLLVFGAAAVSA
jgi:hypothetical protein